MLSWRQALGGVMKKLLLGGLVLTSLIAGPAMAADMPVKAAPPPPFVYNWSGFYVGLNAGGVWGRTNPGMIITPVPGGFDYFAFGAGSPANIAAAQAVGTLPFNNSGFT